MGGVVGLCMGAGEFDVLDVELGVWGMGVDVELGVRVMIGV